MIAKRTFRPGTKPLCLALFALLALCASAVTAQTTTFTFQGKLTDAGNPANGNYDLQFKLFDALVGGTQVGTTVMREDVAVAGGIFTVPLDFGAVAFPGANRWLEIGVRPGVSTGAFTALSPLQPITATPYAMQSLNATTATNATNATNATTAVSFSGALAGDVTGTQSTTALANNAVTTAKLTDGSVTDAKIATVAGSKVTGTIPVAGVPAGSTNYIQNSAILQASSNFNISGNGFIGGNLSIGTTASAAKLDVRSESGIGVYGLSNNGTGVDGNSDSGRGVEGYSNINFGVYGQSTLGAGVAGQSTYDSGVIGVSSSSSLTDAGVHGQSFGSAGIGVFGEAHINNAIGVYGVTYNSLGVGVFGRNLGGTNGSLAGYFDGKVHVERILHVNGAIEKAGGGFKIDHPLDPENKYLVHSFVESPEMKNLYDGTVTTDANGEAEITLQDWFAALNRNFRYQLTCIGVFAQAIIAEKIKDNRFKIKTSLPNVEVSWQITGTRQDAWANQNRLPVEEAKPEVERGFYQNPTAFGQPEERSLEWARHPEMMKQQKEQRERREHAQPNQAAAPAARPNQQ